MNKFTIYPRLIRKEAIRNLDSIMSMAPHQMLNINNEGLNLDSYFYSSVGGIKVTEKELNEIRINIINIAKNNNFPKPPSTINSQQFDRESTIYLFQNLNISINEASKNEIWNFISCMLLPEIVYWRYFYKENEIKPTNNALIDRYLGGRRNCFQKLWWRALVFQNINNNEKEFEFLSIFNGDDFRELEERTSIYGNINLCREIAKNYSEIKKNSMEKIANRDVFRDIIKRTRRYMSWLAFEVLTLSELQTAVKDIYIETLTAFKFPIPNSFLDNTNKDETLIITKSEEPKINPDSLKHINYSSQRVEIDSLKRLKKQAIIDKVEIIFRKPISRETLSRATFITEDNTKLIQIFISARYERKNQKYWFTITNKHMYEMEKFKDSYIILGLSDKDDFFMIPYSWFKEREEFFHKKFYDNESKTHLFIEDEYGENYIVRSKDIDNPYESIETFKYPKTIKNETYMPVTEEQLMKPALKIIQDYGNNGITTSELINKLRETIKPQGIDTELLKGRADDKFSQKVRNLKSHRKLDLNDNISFINNKYYWLKKTVQKIDPYRNLIIPEDIEWRKIHFISIKKEKMHTTGGNKAINQWDILKKFNNSSIYNYQTEAMSITMSDRTNSLFHPSKNGIGWWDQELHFCILKNIVIIKDSNDEIINL